MNEIQFVESLTAYSGTNVFNPWRDYDPEYDIGVNAPVIRRANLVAYLGLRQQVDYIFMAEALGYQGGHFSGIAMTSERMLLGNHEIKPYDIVGNYQSQRVSWDKTAGRVTQKKFGYEEPTATVVWKALRDNGFDFCKVILWNIFPFHPHKEEEMLTNRAPTDVELLQGFEYFKSLQFMYPKAKIVAIGQKCACTLDKFGVAYVKNLRHPSMAGITEFRKGMAELKFNE